MTRRQQSSVDDRRAILAANRTSLVARAHASRARARQATRQAAALTNEQRNLVSKAQRAFRGGGDTRSLHHELAQGNPYARAKLAKLGLVYDQGAIRKES